MHERMDEMKDTLLMLAQRIEQSDEPDKADIDRAVALLVALKQTLP